MSDSTDGRSAIVDLAAIRLGIAAGFFACMAYPLAAFAHLSKLPETALVAFFGPALAVACYGLRQLLNMEKQHLAAALGLLLNALAGALYTAMGLLQLAVVFSAGEEKVSSHLVAIWLGLDVAWDAYVGMGTICFAFAMWRHPRFGRVFAILGIAVGAGLPMLHMVTFPTPPQNAGLVDLGPALGLWYLCVTIQMWRSVGWAKGQVLSQQ